MLTKEKAVQVNLDANKWANDCQRPGFQNYNRFQGYLAGATNEAICADGLLLALTSIINSITFLQDEHLTIDGNDLIKIATKALESFNQNKVKQP